MQEIFTDNVLTVITHSEKLGMIGLLLTVIFGMAGLLYYVLKNVKSSLDKLNATMDKNTELASRMLDVLHAQNTSQLREIDIKIDEMLICCKELKARGER